MLSSQVSLGAGNMWDQGFHACDIGKGQAEDLYNVMGGGTRNESCDPGEKVRAADGQVLPCL